MDNESSNFHFLAGGGEMGERMRALDWTKTPLGPAGDWPQSLKTIVRVMLDSRYAMWMLWGPEFTFFCNDAYLPTVGMKRDWVLGARADAVWAEIWPDIGPRIQRVLAEGQATWDEALLLFLERNGFPEETYHTFSYSPIYDDDSRIAGMLCVVTEVTERVIGERRLRVLRDLAAAPRAESTDEACRRLFNLLAGNPRDVPFAALYFLDQTDEWLNLAQHCGELPESLRPAHIALSRGDGPWPMAAAIHRGASQVVELRAPPGAIIAPIWGDRVSQALVLPVQQAPSTRRAVLVAGISPRRPLDDAYRGFFDLIVRQFAAAIGDAQAYEAERARAEALAEIDRTKTAFFSNVSHEFRTPLTLLLGPIEDALGRPAEGLRGEALDSAHRNALRLLRLVNTLLDFSRIEAGRAQARFVPTNLSALTEELASVFRSAMDRAGLRYDIQCDALPEAIYVDSELWEKIVLNLVSNAFKYTFDGEVRVELHAGEEGAELTVTDTGTGIPPEAIPRLFDRFYRVPGARGRTHEGSGIGLALVRELVKLHGGSIDVESVMGRGSRFRVRIPYGVSHLPGYSRDEHASLPASPSGAPALAEEGLHTATSSTSRSVVEERVRSPFAANGAGFIEERVPEVSASNAAGAVIDEGYPSPSSSNGARAFVEEAQRWLPEPPDMDRSGRFRGLASHALPEASARTSATILLADDNRDMREYVTRLLEAKFTVVTAADGAQALEQLRAGIRPDLVLSDVMMPQLDGFGLLKELRSSPLTREIPVIFLSARAGEEARIEGFEGGADDYLIKPFSARELIARIDAHIRLSRLRREAIERIKVSEERLRIAVDEAGMGTLDWDLRTQEVRWSNSFSRLLGLDPGGSQPPTRELWRSRVHPDDIEAVEAALATARDQHSLYSHEYRIRRADTGAERWIRALGRFLYDEAGTPIRAVGVCFDDSDRKAAEIALRESDRRKDVFLATLAHELRNPLAPIRTAAEVLGAPELERDKLQWVQGVIQRQVQNMALLLDDLLDVARITQGKLELKKRRIALNGIVDAAAEAARPALDRKNHRLTVTLPGEQLTLDADPLRLSQVLSNLLTNAAKYSDPGGHIELSARVTQDMLRLSVKDNGIGIPAESLRTIFTMFAQVEGTAPRSEGGLGIGLAIVRGIVELHGGKVEAKSEGVGRGSEFIVHLPLRAVLVARQNASDEVVAASVIRRILIADDNKDAADTLALLLEMSGHEVRVAYDGRAAVALIQTFRPDTALLDIGMPQLNGYEVARAVRHEPWGAGLALIALTGWGQADDRRRATDAGFDHHLTKPVDTAALGQLLREQGAPGRGS